MLLALRNDKGTIAGGAMYQHAAGGAILAELVLASRVGTVTEGRSTYAAVQDSTPLGDSVLDECLRKMADARRRRTLKTWVQQFSGIRQLKHRVASGLADKGVLRESEATMLLIFTRRIYPERDPAYEKRIVERVSAAIFSDTASVDPRTTVLIAIAHHSGLLKANLDRKRLKTRKARIEAIIKGDAIGKATKEAIQAAHAAVMVGAVMPAIIAATTAR